MSELFDGAVERIGNAVRGLVTLGRVARAVVEAARHVRLDIDEPEPDATPLWQPYGFAAVPLAGSIAVQVAIGGHQDKLVSILVHDRRHIPTLVAGESAIHDDQDQFVAVRRAGVVVKSPAIKLGESATLRVARETDPVVLDAGLIAWLNAVSTAAFTDPPAGAHVPLTSGTATGTISAGSNVTRSE